MVICSNQIDNILLEYFSQHDLEVKEKEIIRLIIEEEKHLENLFKVDYISYKKETRRYLKAKIVNLYLYVKYIVEVRFV